MLSSNCQMTSLFTQVNIKKRHYFIESAQASPRRGDSQPIVQMGASFYEHSESFVSPPVRIARTPPSEYTRTKNTDLNCDASSDINDMDKRYHDSTPIQRYTDISTDTECRAKMPFMGPDLCSISICGVFSVLCSILCWLFSSSMFYFMCFFSSFMFYFMCFFYSSMFYFMCFFVSTMFYFMWVFFQL